MSVVAAYHIFVCALFLVQEGTWTGYGLSRGVFVTNILYIELSLKFINAL